MTTFSTTDPCYQHRLSLETINRELATLKRRRWVILQEMAKLTLYSQGTAILPPT